MFETTVDAAMDTKYVSVELQRYLSKFGGIDRD
jgi:hypothetical protein